MNPTTAPKPFGCQGFLLCCRNELCTGFSCKRLNQLDSPGQGRGPGSQNWSTGKRRSGIELTYSTIHKAKGTEADYVIMLDTGPPRASETAGTRALERAMQAFRRAGAAAEEERRIWYVVLTRAKCKVYLIVAAETESHSPFADDLYHNKSRHYDVGEDELAESLSRCTRWCRARRGSEEEGARRCWSSETGVTVASRDAPATARAPSTTADTRSGYAKVARPESCPMQDDLEGGESRK